MIRVFITPFDEYGNFTAEVEVSDDVLADSLGTIKRALDQTEYDIGILKNSNLTIKLENSGGKYSEADVESSIFRFKRSGSKVRLSWSSFTDVFCGDAIVGESILAEDINLFEGILVDDSSRMNAQDQVIQFQILSYESILDKTIVPPIEPMLASPILSPPNPFPAPSKLLSEILFFILNQSSVTRYISILQGNIVPTIDYIPDSIENLQNKTLKEALSDLLLMCNSTLIIDGNVLFIVGRAPSTALKYTFFGQASELGNENTLDLTDFRNGQNRIINFIRFDQTTFVTKDTFSVNKWGAFVKELDTDYVSTESKLNSLAVTYLNEFKNPKKEFTLKTGLNYEILSLKFLDRVNIDYPTIYSTAGVNFPIIDQTEIGDPKAPLPYLTWAFSLDPSEYFKILAFDIDLKTETVSFYLRGI